MIPLNRFRLLLLTFGGALLLGSGCQTDEVLGNVICGNEVCEPGEDFASCPGDCPPVCGNGLVEGDEACDEGSANSDTADACRNDCTQPRCGDGIADSGEECDGDDLAGATCASETTDRPTGTLTCTQGCTLDTSRCNNCGDGVCVPENEDHFVCPQDCAEPVRIDTGEDTTCVVRADGSVWCWGSHVDPYGAAGDPEARCEPTPMRIPEVDDASAVAVGKNVYWAITEDGSALRWSTGGYGFYVEEGFSAVVTATATLNHWCVLDATLGLWCAGVNTEGQLGNGSIDSWVEDLGHVELEGVVAMTASEAHTCAVTADQALWCWGSNGYGSLGDGLVHQDCDPNPDAERDCSPSPVPVSSLTGVTRVSAWNNRTCAALTDGTVWCWGYREGVCAGLSTVDASTPVQIAGLSDVIDIGTGFHHGCALRNDGTVWCWSADAGGVLGNGSDEASCEPVQVTGLTDVVSIAVGSLHTCALRADGSVWCWGENMLGQLGTGGDKSGCLATPPVFPSSSTPVRVIGF